MDGFWGGRVSAVFFSALWLRGAIAAIAIAGLAGCAVTQSDDRPALEKATPLASLAERPDYFWWQACFRAPYDGTSEPNWAVDHLLAHRVAEPLLQKNADEIALWRFHRRAGVDSAGHQFSVIFYADRATAGAFLDDIAAAPEVGSLVDAGYLTKMVRNCRDAEPDPALEANSDPAWNIHLQRSWPYFIMGASAHWLALIGELDRELGGNPAGIEAQLKHYESIRSEINAIWLGQGQHAYFHHLNAIFGYEPLLIQRRMRF